MKSKILNTINIVSWLQIIGGITGLGLMAYLLLRTDTINGPILLIFLIGLSLFIFSIYTGQTLFYNPDKKKGVTLTVINQILQLIHWSILGYRISYSDGAELLIGLKGATVNFNVNAITSSFQMSIHSQDEFRFQVNLVAILVIYFIT